MIQMRPNLVVNYQTETKLLDLRNVGVRNKKFSSYKGYLIFPWQMGGNEHELYWT